jgi:hypothetical protein
VVQASRGGAEAGVDGEVAREGGQSSLPLHTSRDLALKEGQKIHINVKVRLRHHRQPLFIVIRSD